MNRAYSVFEVKSIDEDQRIIEGFATTPKTDRTGDIVEPMGGVFKVPMPFLFQHGMDAFVGKTAVGHVIAATPSNSGIPVRIKIERSDEPGRLKEILDFAWQSIKKKLVRGLSIGFKDLKSEPIKGTYGLRIKEWEWLELSAVTIPANVEATIHAVKSYDTNAPAAHGNGAPKNPGVSGPVKIIHQPGTRKMTIKDQIIQFENTRAAKAARMSELMTKAGEVGETLDAAQSEEYDTLEAELEAIDKHLVRLNTQEQRAREKAVAVTATNTETAAASRGNGGAKVITVKPQVEKGTAFVRYCMALVHAKGNHMAAAERAHRHWHDTTPEVETALKAAVAAGTTTDATFAGPLVTVNNLAGDFLELLRPATLVGKIPGLRQVPFNVAIPAQTGGGTYNWVGQGSAKPLTSAAFATVTLLFAKIAGIIVLTKELVKYSTPSAEGVIRQEMIDGITQFMDGQFVDPAVAEVANVSPASITNGVTGIAASGTTEAAARTDLGALIKSFSTNNIPMNGLVMLMRESDAFSLAMMTTDLGQAAFPGLSIGGGALFGVPVITSNTVGARIIALHAPSILIADDGNVEIDASEEASLQMDSVPANPTDATTVMVSMFQRNLIALRAERGVTWKKARTNSVNMITGVAYA